MQPRFDSASFTSMLGTAPGDIVQIGGEKLRIETIATSIGPGRDYEEKVMFSGNLADQIEIDDEGQCEDSVERNKLTRKCRKCVFPIIQGKQEISMGAKIGKKK